MKHYVFFLLFISVSSYAQINPNLLPFHLTAFDNLKDSCDGDNWMVNSLEVLTENANEKQNPYITQFERPVQGNPVYFGKLHLRFNGIKGEIPQNFWHPLPESEETHKNSMKLDSLTLAYNEITGIHPSFSRVGHNLGDCNISYVELCHNRLASFRARAAESSLNGSIYYLDISFNLFETIPYSDFYLGEDWNSGLSVLSDNWEFIDISNNYLNFEEIISFKQAVDDRRVDYSGTEPNSDPLIYSPQKRNGEIHEIENLNEGEDLILSFELPHGDNEYQWQLNGEDIPGATCPNLSILNFSEQQSGYYLCKVTNPNLPGLTIRSNDFPVLFNGFSEVNEFSLPITALPPGLFKGAIIAILDSNDYYTLPDTLDNESFAIINGNTLISRERLFQYEIESYEIEIVGRSKFGQTMANTFTLVADPDLIGVDFVQSFHNDFEAINENQAGAIGEIWVVGKDSVLPDYDIELPDGFFDNDMFTINEGVVETSGLNFELKSTYKLLVLARHNDVSTLAFRTIVDVHVTDINEAPNSLLLLFEKPLEVDNNIGDVVGYLIAEDEDYFDTDFSFELVDGFEGNKYVYLTDNIVKASVKFTEPDTIDIKCRVTDLAGAFFERIFQVVIADSDSNSPPTAVGLSNFILDEDWDIGQTVALIFMKDIDGGEGMYTLKEGGDSEYFSIMNDRLEINKELTGHDHKFTIEIVAKDEVGDSISAEFNLYIPQECDGEYIIPRMFAKTILMN